MNYRFLLLAICAIIGINRIFSQLPIQLPALLSDHAVLQKNAINTLWGKGPAGKNIKIIGSWDNSDTINVIVGNDCMWKTQIKTPSSDGTYTLQFISDKQNIIVNDILLGDVWLCSGQSNMEFNMNWGIDTTQESYKIKENNSIRFFQVERNFDNNLVSDVKGKWVICTSENAKSFSTVGYFFGRKIQETLHHPIGLIGSYWGGTNIQDWMPKESFNQSDLQISQMHIDPYEGSPRGYSILYNGMINPLLNYNIKGAVWYQGETNVDYDWNIYGKLLSTMINGWRFYMHNNIPFYTIQIAPWNGYASRRAAILREQVAQLGQYIPNYGTISILDLIDDTTNLHPKIKREVGIRIADKILNEIYHQSQFPATAPKIFNVVFEKNMAIVSIQSTGPVHSSKKNITEFELAGRDSIFYPAQAKIEKDNRIILSSKNVNAPQYLRYSFKNASVPNIFDNSRLSLLPYRTDDFEIK
ncbi:sialate O-acetylesterase [Rhizosphaericola mali]|uniref:Sialate O-acetylesterase n=1 Tax=Rhizosphaericola mali TaxID=2545455 RepID=A0A5P2G9E1_9BACT|nr:sialate O-acetylesterase [Rhizosphaericola mali]QES89833.1 sialate O-acetylesterase [Rhizosphaericola mali]